MSRRYVLERLTPNFGYFYTISRRIHQTDTPYQHLEIVETDEIGKVLLLDGITQVAVEREFLYHEPMVHPALTSHPAPHDICIIGAGDGGITREVLKHGPDRVVHCELDRAVIDTCRTHLPEISQGSLDDARVHLEIGDGRAFIAGQRQAFDVVIMDMTDPFGPSTMLYTQEYYREVKRALKDEYSSFVMHCESPISRPQSFQQILGTLGTIWRHQTVFYVYIQMYGVLWSIVVNADHDDVSTIVQKTIAARLQERGIAGLKVYDPASHHAMQVAYPFIRDLRAGAVDLPIITDADHTFVDEIRSQSTTALRVIEEA